MKKKNAIQYYVEVLKQYAVFTGRAGRREYWYFVLINFLVSFLLSSVFGLFNELLGNIVGGLYGLAVLVPSIGVAVRRLHDVGKSGWMWLISLIPIVGWIWILVLLVRKGDEKENKYGSASKDNFTKTDAEVTVDI